MTMKLSNLRSCVRYVLIVALSFIVSILVIDTAEALNCGRSDAYDRNGLCAVRNLSRGQCGALSGEFQPDRGAGYSLCIYSPRGGGGGGGGGGGRVDCGNGYSCPGGTLCTRDGKCLPLSSERVCRDSRTYCGYGQRCLNRRCISADTPESRICKGGDVVCVAGAKCHPFTKDRCVPDWVTDGSACLNGKFCKQGYFCTSENVCDKIEEPTPIESDDNEEAGRGSTNYIALFSTFSGRFFGVGKGTTQEEAMNNAKETCEAHRDNAGSTYEDRRLECRFSVWTADGCVALANSHDMYYGAESRFVAGMSTDPDLDQASIEALGSCKAKGGENCVVVPESAQCTN